jgi:hypothetical protein
MSSASRDKPNIILARKLDRSANVGSGGRIYSHDRVDAQRARANCPFPGGLVDGWTSDVVR